MIIKKLLKERINLIELIIIALIIGLSIELLSNGLSSLLDTEKWNGIIYGTSLLFLGISYFIFKIIKLKSTKHSIKGFIIYNSKNNDVIEVPRYRYSRELSEDLKCAFNENPALKKIWNSDPLNNRFKMADNGKMRTSIPKSYNLIYQATEYFVIKELSMHLSAYFNNTNLEKKRLQEFNRKDIPSVLLENQFLELFSKPMEQRDAFVDDTLKSKGSLGKVVASYKHGFKFEQFDLVLPKKSKIHKPKGNEILIETSRFKIKFTIDFQGMGTVLPFSFEEYYLNLNNRRDYSEFEISIHVSVNFKLRSYLSRKGWEYFEWVDSYIRKLDEGFSKKLFFEKINWDTMSSAIIVAKNIVNKEKTGKIQEAEVIAE